MVSPNLAIDYNLNLQGPGIISTLTARLVPFGSTDEGPSLAPIVAEVKEILAQRGFTGISESYEPADKLAYPKHKIPACYTLSTAKGPEVKIAGNGERSRWVSIEALNSKDFEANSFLCTVQRRTIGGRFETRPITCY